MSCNLDHVLYDKLNSTDEEKEHDSYAFARRYKEDLPGFISFICDSPFSFKGDYAESWKFIRDQLHSLERNTNFGICVKHALAEEDESQCGQLKE